MGLREQFNEQMKEAMKAKDQRRLSTLRMVNAALKDKDIANRTETSREGISDDEILGLLGKMIKQREESAEAFDKGGRPEMAKSEREEVDIRLHSVIYAVTDEIKKAMEGLLEPTFKEVRLGAAEVREVFRVPKIGAIAGCMVTDGTITRKGDVRARVLRDNVVVHEGKIAGLRRFKDDVSEVRENFECGIKLRNYDDVKEGDRLEIFEIQKIARTLD